MDETLRMYWELFNESCSNELMIHKSHNPLRNFEEEFIEGPILELGCGQSSFLVEYSKTGKEIFAIDNEDFQLSLLKKRIESYAGKQAGKLHLLNITIPKKEIPKEVFSLVIMSDFLHFFSIEDCGKIINQIASRTQKGSLIYIKAHSISHSYFKSTEPGLHQYYKHFFSETDLPKLFDKKYFERIMFSDTVQSVRSKFSREMQIKWHERVLDKYEVFDPEDREEELKSTKEESIVGYLECVYRRK
ncbi:class I SAM-dependent methyltransferase [Flavobacterium terrisoli]|uniref:class I SAM-dependent methyltransferase n=1 Tax=Flavobacterium terrisoli TaxID=3242195 RepID=UPI0025439304|nr:class I SAM-dependent methyltransferase [Flavobacterium buctense]